MSQAWVEPREAGLAPRRLLLPVVASSVLALFPGAGGEGVLMGQEPPPSGMQAAEREYRVYVGAESADLIHRIRFGPRGLHIENSTQIGILPTRVEGPHGLAVSPDGLHLYVTTGHGSPDGMLWKFETGPDTLVAEPITLGPFPATVDVTPDGLYAFAVNFNLYGEHVPSSMSVAYTPDLYETRRIELCTMPHGVRMSPSGERAYTVCMMDDLLVEVDTRSFRVARKFSLLPGVEGPVDLGKRGMEPPHTHDEASGRDRDIRPRGKGDDGPRDMCSPTWAVPAHDGSRVFVACNASDRVHEIHLRRWELLRTFETGRGPYNLDPTPDDRILVATLKQGDAVEFLDLESGQSLGRSPTSASVVHGVTVTPDGLYAFVSVEGVGAEPGKVDVFDLRTLRRVADVPVGQQASGIAFWRMDRAR